MNLRGANVQWPPASARSKEGLHARRRRSRTLEGAQLHGRMQRLVAPDRVLHFVRPQADGGEEDLQAAVPRDAKDRAKLVGNLRQLLGWSGVGNSTGDKNDRVGRKDANNWQHLADVRWLQQDGKAELVPVVGKYPHIYKTVVQPHPDMAFDQSQLKNLLLERIKRTPDGWRWVRRPHSQIWSLDSGTSLVGHLVEPLGAGIGPCGWHR